MIVFSKTLRCKNPAFFGPFETRYSNAENLILNIDSKYDSVLDQVKNYLQVRVNKA